MSELKNCPFCGGKADFTVTGDRYFFCVKCDGCGALAGGSLFENNEYNARKWNTRASPWIPCKDRLPEPSKENKLQSVKVINQDGDSVYYSYGYKRWIWWLSVNFEEENSYPTVTSWSYIPAPPDKDEA